MKYLPWAIAAAILVLALYLTDYHDHRADVAEGKALVADSLRKVAEDRAQKDSLALESAKNAFVADSSRLAGERLQAVRRASQASEQAKETANVLRESLDAQQAVLLDSLEASHAEEIRAKDDQIAQADSATVVEHSLRLLTEQALASERQAYQADVPLIGALRAEVGSLQRARRWDRFKGAGIVAVIIAGTVILH